MKNLTYDLLSRFSKEFAKKETKGTDQIVFGTIVNSGNEKYIQIDGSTQITPYETMSAVSAGDRVMAIMKNHSVIVAGSTTSPAASQAALAGVAGQSQNVYDMVAHDVTDNEKQNVDKILDELEVKVGAFEELNALKATIEDLRASIGSFDKITANEAKIIKGYIDDLEGGVAQFDSLTVDAFTAETIAAVKADINQLRSVTGMFTYVSADRLDAIIATINTLNTKYANIDFANIGEAAIEKLFATTGFIENLTFKDGKFTGELSGVTVRGENIIAGTIYADKIMFKGPDDDTNFFYQLNLNAAGNDIDISKFEDQAKEQIIGSSIAYKTLTADHIDVGDLSAFAATIGGFAIDSDSIHTATKDSVNNNTAGIYMNKRGEVAIGDGTGYIKFYRQPLGIVDAAGHDYNTEYGPWKLDITAESILYSASGHTERLHETINRLVEASNADANNAIRLGAEGILIADMNTYNLGTGDVNNVLISGSGVDVRIGTDVIASFGDRIRLTPKNKLPQIDISDYATIGIHNIPLYDVLITQKMINAPGLGTIIIPDPHLVEANMTPFLINIDEFPYKKWTTYDEETGEYTDWFKYPEAKAPAYFRSRGEIGIMSSNVFEDEVYREPNGDSAIDRIKIANVITSTNNNEIGSSYNEQNPTNQYTDDYRAGSNALAGSPRVCLTAIDGVRYNATTNYPTMSPWGVPAGTTEIDDYAMLDMISGNAHFRLSGNLTVNKRKIDEFTRVFDGDNYESPITNRNFLNNDYFIIDHPNIQKIMIRWRYNWTTPSASNRVYRRIDTIQEIILPFDATSYADITTNELIHTCVIPKPAFNSNNAYNFNGFGYKQVRVICDRTKTNIVKLQGHNNNSNTTVNGTECHIAEILVW